MKKRMLISLLAFAGLLVADESVPHCNLCHSPSQVPPIYPPWEPNPIIVDLTREPKFVRAKKRIKALDLSTISQYVDSGCTRPGKEKKK